MPPAVHSQAASLAGPVVDGRLVVWRCVATKRAQAYGVRRCACCWNDALEHVPASGDATLVAGVRYQRTYDERWVHPYVVVVARLAEGPEVFAVLVDEPHEVPHRDTALRIGVDAPGVLRARVTEPNGRDTSSPSESRS